MSDNITWIGLDVSESLGKHVKFSFDGFEKKCKNITSCQASLVYNEAQNPDCEVTFFVFLKGKMMISKSSSFDMYKAISDATSKMTAKISKEKGKHSK